MLEWSQVNFGKVIYLWSCEVCGNDAFNVAMFSIFWAGNLESKCSRRYDDSFAHAHESQFKHHGACSWRRSGSLVFFKRRATKNALCALRNRYRERAKLQAAICQSNSRYGAAFASVSFV